MRTAVRTSAAVLGSWPCGVLVASPRLAPFARARVEQTKQSSTPSADSFVASREV
jgi:hypothetical protein